MYVSDGALDARIEKSGKSFKMVPNFPISIGFDIEGEGNIPSAKIIPLMGKKAPKFHENFDNIIRFLS